MVDALVVGNVFGSNGHPASFAACAGGYGEGAGREQARNCGSEGEGSAEWHLGRCIRDSGATRRPSCIVQPRYERVKCHSARIRTRSGSAAARRPAAVPVRTRLSAHPYEGAVNALGGGRLRTSRRAAASASPRRHGPRPHGARAALRGAAAARRGRDVARRCRARTSPARPRAGRCTEQRRRTRRSATGSRRDGAPVLRAAGGPATRRRRCRGSARSRAASTPGRSCRTSSPAAILSADRRSAAAASAVLR